jgi:hypothetical protein
MCLLRSSFGTLIRVKGSTVLLFHYCVTYVMLCYVDFFHGEDLSSPSAEQPDCSRLRLKCDGTRAETRFRLSAKRTSPFNL